MNTPSKSNFYFAYEPEAVGESAALWLLRRDSDGFDCVASRDINPLGEKEWTYFGASEMLSDKEAAELDVQLLEWILEAKKEITELEKIEALIIRRL